MIAAVPPAAAIHQEKRLIHHQGDGHFSLDGETLDLRERMVKWRDLMD